MTLNNAGALLTTAPPWLYWLTCTHSEFTDLSWALQRKDFADGVVRVLRGRKMKTISALIDEISAALQFPYYFGENWNALDECLADLDWLAGRSYLLMISDALQVLSDESEEDFTAFMDLVTRTGEAWAGRRMEGNPWDRSATPFHVVVQCVAGDEERLAERLRTAGIEPVALSLSR